MRFSNRRRGTFFCAVQGCTNVAKRRMRESDLRQKKVPKEKATPSYATALAFPTGLGPALPDAASCRGGTATDIPVRRPFGALTQTGGESERSTRGENRSKNPFDRRVSSKAGTAESLCPNLPALMA